MRLLVAAVVAAASFDPARAQVFGGIGGTANGQNSAAVFGGELGIASGQSAAAVGGSRSTATGPFDVVVGGDRNTASDTFSVAVGGTFNAATSLALAAGGISNKASGLLSTTVGGKQSIASGESSMTAGGGWNTAAAMLSTAIGLGASIDAAHDSAVAISAYSVQVKIGLEVEYSAPNQTCASMGAGSLTLCATNNITLLGAALVVNSVDVLKAIGNTQGQVAALQASGASQANQITALQAQLAALQAAFVAQCGAPATNSTGRRLWGCRSAAATDAPTQPDKLPFIIGGAVAGGLLLGAVAVLMAMRLKRGTDQSELATVADQ
jgi:hypothetical protein